MTVDGNFVLGKDVTLGWNLPGSGSVVLSGSSTLETGTDVSAVANSVITINEGSHWEITGDLTLGGTDGTTAATLNTYNLDKTSPNLTVNGTGHLKRAVLTGNGYLEGDFLGSASGYVAIAPGWEENPTGFLYIDGNLNLANTGLEYFAFFNDDSSNSIVVSGTATMGGTLSVHAAVADGTEFEIADSYLMLAASSLYSSFSNYSTALESTLDIDCYVDGGFWQLQELVLGLVGTPAGSEGVNLEGSGGWGLFFQVQTGS